MTRDSKAAFKVKTPGEAFHDYTESEVLRMRETDPRFDEDFYRQASELVAARLVAAQAEMRVDEPVSEQEQDA